MTIRRSVAVLISAAALLTAACSASPTAPAPKGCDVVTVGPAKAC